MSLLVLSAADVREVISSFGTTFLQALMGRVFIAISQAGEKSISRISPDIQTPHRTTIDMTSHTTLFMPARISSSQSSVEGTSIKVVSVPRNQGDVRGLPATTLVMNEDTGAVEAVVNARELTSLRNAAGSLLSATLVRVHKPERIVLFGAGKQVESHINLFLRHYSSIKSCTIVNRTLNERALDLFKSATAAFPRVSSRHCCLRDTIHIPSVPSSWVRNGTHIILIGSYKPSMQEAEETLVGRAVAAVKPVVGQRINQALIVDSRTACMQEAGDLLKAGVDSTSMLEMGELLLLKKPQSEFSPQHSPAEEKDLTNLTGFTGPITIFKSVGVGLQDVVMAKEVVSHAKNIPGAGTLIERYDTMY
ncbi:hypothetical protein D9756_009088 [Leucocoprinus leucothites]|uniref:Ketimine reductase mu-crystallin n=1 Tax=Leucocoprinus leucothites TaxID=201217 RepID=A0A8H5CXW2_9AGAR|nr:hypothetical protein D9756_009088 [Leucoagaricus leucothites]